MSTCGGLAAMRAKQRARGNKKKVRGDPIPRKDARLPARFDGGAVGGVRGGRFKLTCEIQNTGNEAS